MQKEHSTLIADFSVQGRLAYLSHQETLSFWQRVLIRAQAPLVFSLGFNPRPRVSLPLPRSVGVQSDCERLCALVQSERFDRAACGRAIADLLPPGFVLRDVTAAEGKAAFYPAAVTCRLTLASPPDAARQRHFEHCIEQTQTADPIIQERLLDKGRRRTVNIRPFIELLSVCGQVVEAACVIDGQGTVRMDELLRWLAIEPQELAEPIRRTAV
jgi:radical SAM-linked protein